MLLRDHYIALGVLRPGTLTAYQPTRPVLRLDRAGHRSVGVDHLTGELRQEPWAGRWWLMRGCPDNYSMETN